MLRERVHHRVVLGGGARSPIAGVDLDMAEALSVYGRSSKSPGEYWAAREHHQMLKEMREASPQLQPTRDVVAGCLGLRRYH